MIFGINKTMDTQEHNNSYSLGDAHSSVDTTSHNKGWKKVLSFFGPAYLVSVGYMDPGNWATDLQGGAQFGYKLIWILLMSNLMALLLQNLSARLGIVNRKDLAQVNREVYPPLINVSLYVLAEIAIAACDLAEVLGMALGLYLLTGLPLIWGILVTVFDTFLLLWLQKFGIRKLEAFIVSLVAIIGASFLVEIFLAKPHPVDVLKGFMPTSLNKEALYIAIGIIGATVMPHNLYLHSALVQTRQIGSDEKSIKKAIRFNLLDTTIALNAAFLVNCAILILAASVFYYSGHHEVAKIEDAHRLLAPLLGSKLAPIIFAIALIAAGQSSTITGTLAGQIVMEGYLHVRINPKIRRLITRLLAIIPAVLTILIFGESKIDTLLVLSQVVLSIQLGFAVIPLIHFVSDKKRMGQFAIRWHIKILAWLVAGILVFLNVKMVSEQVIDFFGTEGNIFWKIIIMVFSIIFIWLFFAMTFIPIIQTRIKRKEMLHGEMASLTDLTVKPIRNIAIALDFSKKDEHLIAYALAQGNKEVHYTLIHIVESASAKYLGEDTDDDETRQDIERLNIYTQHLIDYGYKATGVVGYRSRIKEIVRIVNESEADLLVMGSHKHSGIRDYIFGETIDAVRHVVEVPVLIV